VVTKQAQMQWLFKTCKQFTMTNQRNDIQFGHRPIRPQTTSATGTSATRLYQFGHHIRGRIWSYSNC